MRIGLILTGGSVRADVEMACAAEAAGFDGVYSIEFFNRHGYVPLGAIAQATSRVRIGSAIANAFTRSPLVHAAAAMDLDELSNGRLVLGLVELLRAAFAAQKGGGFRWSGEHWKLSVPIYARPGAPRVDIPIWIAAVNRGMIAAAGAAADGLVGHPIATRRWHREVTLPGLREGERSAGRREGACALAPYVITSIQDDREAAIADAKNQIGFYFTTGIYHSILDLHGLRAVGDA